MMNLGKIDVHGLSVRGEDHDRNYDHFAIATLNKSMRVHQTNLSIDEDSRVHGHSQGHLFLVADGIGGPAPARASVDVVDSVVRYFLNEMPWYHLADGEPEDVILALEDALRNSQEELLRSPRNGAAGTGTTMTLAFVFWPDLYVAHVGDSRCYLRRAKRLVQLTRDPGGSSDPDATELPAGDLEGSHLAWDAAAGDTKIHPEIRHVLLRAGDALALVTDGVGLESSESELRSILTADIPAEDACGHLVDGPGRDDRTAIVVRFLPPEAIHSGERDSTGPPPKDAHRDPPKPFESDVRHRRERPRFPSDPNRTITAAG